MKLLPILAIICSAIASTLSASQQPNIIFILCDDLGYGDVGVFYQNERARVNNKAEPWHFTPQLDKMAAEGAMLPHHYAAAPVCAPSRASLMGGVHQGHSNLRNNQFDKALEDNHTLASVLQDSGYATFAVGKWGIHGYGGPKPEFENGYPAHPLNRGFDQYFGYLKHKDGHRHYPKEDGSHILDNTTDVTADYDACYTTDLFTARTKQWIIDHQENKPEQPFFVYLAHDTPHAELQVPTMPYPTGGGLDGGMRWLGKSGKMINTAQGRINSWIHPDYANARWKKNQPWPDVYQRYATMVRRIDDSVGDLIHLLKDLKIDDNTLIVFTSDNGPSKESYMKEPYAPDFFNSFGPFDGIKRDLLEGGIRVGALARWPAQIAPATICDAPSAFWDWMPTFTEMAGKRAPARSDGVSLLPMLTGKGTQQASQLYFEYQKDNKSPSYQDFLPEHRNLKRGNMQAIRIDDFIGVRYNIKDPKAPFSIYNVVRDPQQSRNLSVERKDLQQQMQDRILQMRRPSVDAQRAYDKIPVPSVKTHNLELGLNWFDYSINSSWVANTKGLKASANGQIETFDNALESISEGSQRLVTGYFSAPSTGKYTFTFTGDAQALIRLHELTLIDADANYISGNSLSATIHLQAGMHPLRCYFKPGGAYKVLLECSGPGFEKIKLPASALFR
ncbi:MAG: sulfatase-like hydrolase/transferase [Lentimonas sp.]